MSASLRGRLIEVSARSLLVDTGIPCGGSPSRVMSLRCARGLHRGACRSGLCDRFDWRCTERDAACPSARNRPALPFARWGLLSLKLRSSSPSFVAAGARAGLDSQLFCRARLSGSEARSSFRPRTPSYTCKGFQSQLPMAKVRRVI